MSQPTRYMLHITRRGSPSKPFGWEIRRQDSSGEVKRSTETFRTRAEALADSARAAAPWALASTVDEQACEMPEDSLSGDKGGDRPAATAGDGKRSTK